MDKKYKFNRQKNDYLLTDLLPYEKGNHYTHRYLYEFLQNNKKKFNQILSQITKENSFFDSKWHSYPLKFKISKSRDSFREISLINPLGLLESLFFINLFEGDIINVTHNKNDFSSRKASRSNLLTYKKRKNQTVYYTDDPQTKNQLLISLESSGTFFKHYPFKTIIDLRNSKRFTYSRDKFDLLLMIDIQRCFPSIYTHSFKWLVSNKTYDSKNLANSNSVYRNIDVFLQNINGSKTNGIIVGPEMSRLLVEFLFVHLDQKLIDVLYDKDLVINQNYQIYRFVDDYFIFANNENNQKIIKAEISNILNDFQLQINELKVTRLGKEDIHNNWYLEVVPIIQMVENIFSTKAYETTREINHLLSIFNAEENLSQWLAEVAPTISENIDLVNNKSIKQQRKVRYLDIRSKVNAIVSSSTDSSLICSYVLSAILKKIENHQNDLLIRMEINELITLIIFIYVKDVTYTSTQKVIRILSLLIESEIEDIREMVERNLERFEKDIFVNYTNDWIDLLLFFSNYEIDIANSIIQKITKRCFEEEVPLNIAALCLLADSKHIDSVQIVKGVNKIIKNNIQIINWKDFFQDERAWWIFLFFSFPRLNKGIKKEIKEKLISLKDNLRANPSDEAKKYIIDFLLSSNKHFIIWDFTSENYYKKYFFFTKDRSVFNPGIIDQVSVSK